MSKKANPLANDPVSQMLAELAGKKKSKLTINDVLPDEEFAGMLSPQSADEYELLRDDILKFGFRDPIILWKGYNLLLDGYHRWQIWKTDLQGAQNKGPAVVEMDFINRDAAKLWILKHQLCRRNLTAPQRVKVVLQMQEILKTDAKKNQDAGVELNFEKGQQRVHVDEELAKAANTSRDTVQKVRRVEHNGTPELNSAMDNKVISVNTADKAAKLPADEQRKIVEAAQKSKKASVQAANELESGKSKPGRGTEARIKNVVRQMHGGSNQLSKKKSLEGLRKLVREQEMLREVVETLTKIVKDVAENPAMEPTSTTEKSDDTDTSSVV